MAGRVDRHAGIGVFPPGATHFGVFLDHLEVVARFAELDRRQQAREAGTYHQHLEIRVRCTTPRALAALLGGLEAHLLLEHGNELVFHRLADIGAQHFAPEGFVRRLVGRRRVLDQHPEQSLPQLCEQSLGDDRRFLEDGTNIRAETLHERHVALEVGQHHQQGGDIPLLERLAQGVVIANGQCRAVIENLCVHGCASYQPGRAAAARVCCAVYLSYI